MKKRLILWSILIFWIFTGNAGAFEWKIDKAHSELRFEIRHIFSTVTGQFAEFDGSLVFNPDQLKDAAFDFIVKTKSVNTHNSKRDTHLRSKDFFQTDTYPDMVFKSSKIRHTKDNRYLLEGLLTIKDVQKPVIMEFTFFGPKPHPLEKKSMVAGFDTSFEINRLDYHVGDGRFFKMGVVQDTVVIKISVEALKKE